MSCFMGHLFSLIFSDIMVLTKSLFPRYVSTPGSLELNKYAIAIDMSNSLDSNSRRSQELFGGGRLASPLAFVSARSSLRFFRSCLVLCCKPLSIISGSDSVWELSPFKRGRFPSFGLLLSGISLSPFNCMSAPTTFFQDLNGFEFGDDGAGCVVQHARLSVITTIFLHREH